MTWSNILLTLSLFMSFSIIKLKQNKYFLFISALNTTRSISNVEMPFNLFRKNQDKNRSEQLTIQKLFFYISILKILKNSGKVWKNSTVVFKSIAQRNCLRQKNHWLKFSWGYPFSGNTNVTMLLHMFFT